MSAHPHIGEALLERYRLGRQGWKTRRGMVYDGVALATGKAVTIEIAHDLTGADRERFERDAMLAERFTGVHVLHVYEVGSLVDGTPWLVREPTLGTIAADIDARGPLPTAEAVALTLEVCEALAEGHANGMAHGEVDPGNVHVVTDTVGNPIAKLRWTTNAKADVAADVAGAALLLRFLMTGERDIETEGVKTLPGDLAHAVARAVSKHHAPFENIAEFSNAIARYAPAGHSSARKIQNLIARGVGGQVAMRRQQQQPGVNDDWFESRAQLTSYPPPPPRHRGGVFAAVAALLVGGTLAGTLFLYSTGRLPEWSGTGPTMDQGPRVDEIDQPRMNPQEIADETEMTAPIALLAPKGDEEGAREKSAGVNTTQSPMYDVDENGNPVSSTTTTGADITPEQKEQKKTEPNAAAPTAPPEYTAPTSTTQAPSPSTDEQQPSTDDTSTTTPKEDQSPGF